MFFFWKVALCSFIVLWNNGSCLLCSVCTFRLLHSTPLWCCSLAKPQVQWLILLLAFLLAKVDGQKSAGSCLGKYKCAHIFTYICEYWVLWSYSHLTALVSGIVFIYNIKAKNCHIIFKLSTHENTEKIFYHWRCKQIKTYLRKMRSKTFLNLWLNFHLCLDFFSFTSVFHKVGTYIYLYPRVPSRLTSAF